MLYDNISTSGGNGTAVRWSDTVGIAEYWFADIHKMTEDTPSSSLYIKPSAHVLPFFIPFRARTVNGLTVIRMFLLRASAWPPASLSTLQHACIQMNTRLASPPVSPLR